MTQTQQLRQLCDVSGDPQRFVLGSEKKTAPTVTVRAVGVYFPYC
jgi:hypothetical protein